MTDGDGWKHTARMLSSQSFWEYAARPIVFMRPEYLAKSGWHEHVPFAFWLIEAHRPRCVVELGCHYGVSYFAFCQAVQAIGLNARCYGVDTWKGDNHAGLYDESVFREVDAHNSALYSGFSRLVRSTFDQALEHFSDGEIDLLHIDGHHSFESVLHDFESWLPKLSDRAIVVMHDTNVRERGFGVYHLFEQLRAGHPGFEFLHGHGLGILGTGSNYSADIKRLFNLDAGADQLSFQELFSRMGRACADAYWAKQYNLELSEQKKATQAYKSAVDEHQKKLEAKNADLTRERAEREKVGTAMSELAKNSDLVRKLLGAKELELQSEQTERESANRRLVDLAKALEIKDIEFLKERAAYENVVSQVADLTKENNSLRLQLEEKSIAADQLEIRIDGLSTEALDLKSRIRERFEEIAALTEMLRERDRVLDGSQVLKREALLEIGKYVQFMLGRPSLSFIDRWREKRLAHRLAKLGLFNSQWYLQTYGDVAKAGINPAYHYVRYGSKEGRAPRGNLNEILASFTPKKPKA